MSFAETYGPWALVTGAGQGMGAAFASDLAGRGIGVALVDREEGLLAARAQELQGLGAQTREIVVDLVRPGAADRVLEAVADVEVGLLVSNAAMVYVGEFLDQGARAGLDQITVNCTVPLALVHALLPAMVARGRGHHGGRSHPFHVHGGGRPGRRHHAGQCERRRAPVPQLRGRGAGGP